MKYSILVFALSMMMLSSPGAEAKELQSKGGESQAHLLARGFDMPNFIGSEDASFAPLTFANDLFIKGDAIVAKSNGFKFTLEKGLYVISFSGIFQVFTGTSTAWEVAIKTGHRIHTPFRESSLFIKETSFTKAIYIQEKTDLSIVVRNVTNDTALNAITRSLSIIKKS